MPTAPLANRLLAALTFDDQQAVLSASTRSAFDVGYVFHERGDAIANVHFIQTGLISTLVSMQDGRSVETSMIGLDGISCAHAALGQTKATSRLVAQTAGTSIRLDTVRLQALINQLPGLRAVIWSYAARLAGDLEQSCACNALHRSEQRFAKWLCRCHDHLGDNMICLTQEYLAGLLGSQRTTVSEAAQGLQRSGAITYARGRIRIVDRSELERAACECYAERRLAA